MADEVAVGGAGAAGAGTGGGSSSPGVGGTSMTEAQVSAPGGDVAFLNAEPAAPNEAAPAVEPKPGEEAAPSEEAAPAEIDLSALEEGQPEWLAKVTDPDVKAEIEKLLNDANKF